MHEIAGKYTSAKVFVEDLSDSNLVGQIIQIVNHPAFTNPIAIMPDCHVGKGCVIGFVMKLTDKIVPNVVGVDIGCGVLAANLGYTKALTEKELLEVDAKIRKAIPFGFATHKSGNTSLFDYGGVTKRAYRIKNALNSTVPVPPYGDAWFKDLCQRIGISEGRALGSIGTLGGGNHFIEFGRAADGFHWVFIHSGSRNLGLKVCECWQKIAAEMQHKRVSLDLQEEILKLRAQGDYSTLQTQVDALKDKFNSRIPKGLEMLEGDYTILYLYDMLFAQHYAEANRQKMLQAIFEIVEPSTSLILNTIESVHNYMDTEDLIIRKGAIKSYGGQRMVIPLNMRDGILICEGNSNPDWLCSAPHGAGRILSRSQARKTLGVEQFQQDMKGVFSTSVGKATLDESPRVYKDGQEIMAAIEPTATVIHKITPVHNMKAGDGGD